MLTLLSLSCPIALSTFSLITAVWDHILSPFSLGSCSRFIHVEVSNYRDSNHSIGFVRVSKIFLAQKTPPLYLLLLRDKKPDLSNFKSSNLCPLSIPCHFSLITGQFSSGFEFSIGCLLSGSLKTNTLSTFFCLATFLKVKATYVCYRHFSLMSKNFYVMRIGLMLQ